jgi:mevalonate kinase
MNSSQLKNRFPKVYEEFFHKCSKAVSAPHSFFWTGDFSGFYGGLTIASKLPFRFYIGLEGISKDDFKINDEFDAYFPTLKKFKKIRLEPHIKNELQDLLAVHFRGYRVHFLSELSLGLSLGGLGAISAGLATLIKPEANFEKKFNIAKTIALQIQTGRTSAATVYSSLSTSAYPTVFYQSGARWWGKSLDQIEKMPKNPVWPFDFGLIFSGNLVQGAAVIQSAEEIKKISLEREKEISRLIGSGGSSFWDNYIKMLDQVSKQTLLDFIRVFKSGADENTLKKFFEGLNQYQNLLHFLEISTSNIDRIYSLIHRLSNKIENHIGSGCKLTGVGKGGEVLFALPYGSYREELADLVSQVPGSSLDYASWEDGIESEAVKIEQDLSKDILSNFSKKAKAILRVYSKEKSYSKLLFKDEKIDADLVLDGINGKILFKNKSVDSSAIPSQKATVEIISLLLNSQSHQLQNEFLGKYGKSRYDLQGKITTPLTKLTGLNFEISGGAYDNFTLKLKNFDILIAVIFSI